MAASLNSLLSHSLLTSAKLTGSDRFVLPQSGKCNADKPGRMKSRIARWSFIVTWAVAALAMTATAQAQTDDEAAKLKLEAQEKEDCSNHLKLIYDAIQAYQMDHKDLPNWLSDLVPQYLTDANVLICPVCKRTGQAEVPGLADPKISCSYLFEFSPQPLGKALPGNPTKTRREWKRRQMGMVGSMVPIVRCRQHKVVLNLAFDGKIYESPPSWEKLLTNRLDIGELSPARIFAGEAKATNAPAKSAAPELKFLPRSPQAKPGQIDLSHFYNAMLAESWHGNTNNNLASLPTGLQTFAGVEFDVRGIVQLAGKAATPKNLPTQVKGIKVHLKCQRLNFLHATGFGGPRFEGKQVGTYVIHYTTNQMRLEIPIYYGNDVRDWHEYAGEEPGAKELTVAWTGANESSKAAHRPIRLFKTTWVNLAPDVEIESIDYVSAMLAPAPFLIAITAE